MFHNLFTLWLMDAKVMRANAEAAEAKAKYACGAWVIPATFPDTFATRFVLSFEWDFLTKFVRES